MKQGFTLIELLVVVLIIGILAAIALPQYQTVVDKSRYTQLMSNVDAMYKAQQVYYMSNGVYAVSFHDLDSGLFPSGYKILASGTGMYGQVDFHIFLGFSGNSRKSSYLYSTDEKAGVGYYVAYKNGARSCWAYPGGAERAQRLCQNMTGKTNPRTDSVTQALIYDF